MAIVNIDWLITITHPTIVFTALSVSAKWNMAFWVYYCILLIQISFPLTGSFSPCPESSRCVLESVQHSVYRGSRWDDPSLPSSTKWFQKSLCQIWIGLYSLIFFLALKTNLYICKKMCVQRWFVMIVFIH